MSLNTCGIFAAFLLVFFSPANSQLPQDTKFTIDLLRYFSQSESGNYAISPVSLTFGLRMLYEGLGDFSRGEIEKLLGFVPATAEQELEKLRSVESSKSVSMGNLILMDSDSHPKQAYVSALRNKYNASPFIQPFMKSEISRLESKVNNWVADNTKGVIKNFLAPGSIDRQTRILLVNALAFKDDWKHEFPAELTEFSNFTLSSGERVLVPMMNADLSRIHAKVENGVTAVVLPFLSDESITMSFVMGSDDEAVFQALSDGLMDDLFEYETRMPTKEVRISLPKFSFATRLEMTDPLRELGLKSIFGIQADFSRMARNTANLFVDFISQKTDIDVNEVGVTAAAATGISITLYSLFVPDLTVSFDKPFYLFINKNDTIMFAGKVANP